MPQAWRGRAYCLTPNHVHLILVSYRKEALGRALGEGTGAGRWRDCGVS